MFHLPCFKNPELLTLALVHPSYANEHFLPENNQRLEFLGDAVLKAAFSDHLYRSHPYFSEGKMTIFRSEVEKNKQLAKFARLLKLGDRLRLGRGAKSQKQYQQTKVLADTFEALIGAYYLDSSLDSVIKYMAPFWSLMRVD